MHRILFAGILVAGTLTLSAQDDPPSRVARLNFLEGSVSIQPNGTQDWNPAAPNYPLTIGDHLWVDQGSRAELRVGSTAFRLNQNTAIAFLNLDDRMTQVQLSAGTLTMTVRHLDGDDSYEIDTPNGAVTPLTPGVYRITTDPDQQISTVTVRRGDAEVAAIDTLPVHALQTGVITGSGDQTAMQVRPADPPDDFDRWWMDRDARFDRRPPPRYVSPDMIGYEDLDDHGSWRDVTGYGAVWYPNGMAADWAPYHYGHWAMVEPWGWTWIDDAPWGFAPFHYGRWAFIAGTWGWVPGPVYARPVYAPALVAWVGGGGFGAGLSFGVGGGVAWVPLGPREPYIPSYHVSEVYVNRVNMVEVTHINVTNVTNITYVNRTVPNAVVAVSRTDFAAARPVARVAVRVTPQAMAQATVSTREVPITRQQAAAVRPAAAPAPAVHPPQRVVNTAVVTKAAPPPATRVLAKPPSAPNLRATQAIQSARPAAQPATVNRPAQQQQPVNRPPAQAAEPARPAQQQQQQPVNRPPAQAAPAYRPPAQQPETSRPPQQQQQTRPPQPQQPNRPAQQPEASRPQQQQQQARPPQPQQPNRPAQQPETSRPPQQQQQARPQQQQPAYRPPAQQTEPSRPPREAAPARPQNEPSYRPPAQQSQRTQPPAERPKQESKPNQKEKDKEKKEK